MRESAKFLATSAQTCPDARWHWNIHCSCRNLLCSCRNLFFNFIAGRVHHQNRKKKQQTIDFGNLETSVHELINSFKSFILGMIEWVRCYLVFILKKKKHLSSTMLFVVYYKWCRYSVIIFNNPQRTCYFQSIIFSIEDLFFPLTQLYV